MTFRSAVLAMLVINLGAVATAAASSIRYDYDRDVDFSTWGSVAWQYDAPSDLSLAEKRITRALEAGFADKGYTWIEDRSMADFVVDYRAVAWQDVYAEGDPAGPPGGRYVRMQREAVGALVIDVYERATGHLAWRGMVSDALSKDPDEADRKIAKAVAKLLKKFPSKGGAK